MSDELKYLNEIYEKRKKYIDAVRENEFEEGILSLLSELYPDEAHFIFELLQNAEDAGARNVKFDLMPDHLRFTHNGERLFSRRDVEAITSIAKSPKKDDVNKIGKFGIGFKAVFSYTKTPRIYSGGFNFEIRDLVCPHPISPIDQSDHETVFVFPFNNPDKEPESCIREIQSVFEKADETFLLFLNNIQSICWTVNVGKGVEGRIEREVLDKALIKIEWTHSGSEYEKLFLKYQKPIPGHGSLKCNVAFQVEQRKGSLKIVPTNGKLCIFFPADKENTGLRFHINGPYASSIDRASIKHSDKDNVKILNATAELLVESLEDLKERELLGLDLLEVLPNDDDLLADFYAELRVHLLSALKNKPLVPARDGGFCSAQDLVYGPKKLSDCISSEQMEVLSDRPGKRWAIGAIRNSRAHRLLSSLEIPTWDEDDLLSDLDDSFGKWVFPLSKRHEKLDWLQKQDDQWIVRFYLLLRRILKEKDREYLVKSLQIVRGSKGHYFGDEVFFDSGEISGDYDLHFVKNSLFIGLNSDQKKKLKEFLSLAGVREIGEREAIENILNKYYRSDTGKVTVAKSTHIRHMRRFVKWYRETQEISLFEGYAILRTNDSQDVVCYEPSDLFLDKPFLETNLSYVYENSNSPLHLKKKALWHEYKKIKGFVCFVKSLGVESFLSIVKIAASRRYDDEIRPGGLLEFYHERWNHYRIDEDHIIQSLEDILGSSDIKISQLVWDTMTKADERVLEARFRPNMSWPLRTAPSALVLLLRERAWIPTRNGEFKKPRDISKKQLAEGFNLVDSTGWLEAIGFGEKEKQENQKEKEKLAKIQSLGLTLESYELALMVKDNLGLIAQLKERVEKEKQKPEFPERTSINPKRRATKTKASVKKAPDKEYKKKMASRRTSSGTIDKRKYLVEKYTNEDSQMVCQICKNEMPFKLREGGYYFEAVEAIGSGNKEHESNYLALCPLCTAMYKEWIKKDQMATELFRTRVLEQDELDIPIEMDNKHYTVSFVEQHLIDFKAYLEEATCTEIITS